MTETVTIPRAEWERVQATAEAALIVVYGLLNGRHLSLESEEIDAAHERLQLLKEAGLPLSVVAESVAMFVDDTDAQAPSGRYPYE